MVTSNQRTGRIWIKLFSSTNSSKIYSNGEWTTRVSTLLQTGKNWEHSARIIKTEPGRAYSDSFRLARSRPTQFSSGFTPFRHQKISGQESPLFTIPGSFQEKTRIKGKEQDFFQPKEERVRPNDTEAVELGERSTKELEIVLNTSNRIRSPSTRNITPTQIEHSVFTPERCINSNDLGLQMSQFSEQSSKKTM
ncbi:hypothetical protein O181_085617 [Austropuccinia psidii MF-1]|uniref:Uncharacterized protein n=1 Tax=Austropuccinia psidii MF-1 TaxID=1389203 RepID=A0A9Q3FWE2_9BASI|nr:hypothetical protein [Austropuccinia psidii MF-1]